MSKPQFIPRSPRSQGWRHSKQWSLARLPLRVLARVLQAFAAFYVLSSAYVCAFADHTNEHGLQCVGLFLSVIYVPALLGVAWLLLTLTKSTAIAD